MSKKLIMIICFGISFLLGVPFKWVQYKGDIENVSVFKVLDLGVTNLFFDFALLILNAAIIYFIWSTVLNIKGKTSI